MNGRAFIYDAVRTPRSRGKEDGALRGVKPIDLGAGVLRALQERNDLDTSRVEDVIFGCVTPVNDQGGNMGKMCAQNAGYDEVVAGIQLNRFCGSGLEAVNTAAQKVMSGWENLVIAGGVESMSRVPFGADNGPMQSDAEFMARQKFVHQGIGADMIATMDGRSREDVDAYGLASQQRAAHARDNGYFDKSIVPVLDNNGDVILAKDDFIRPDTTMAGLAKLKPAFKELGQSGMDDIVLGKYSEFGKIDHVHTAGNSSGYVDGSAAVLIGSEQAGKDLGLTPRARIIAGSIVANCSVIMLVGPGPASKKALLTAGLTMNDIDLWETNEAFASVVLRYMKDLDIDHSVTNVNGGAIAMGHPLGATGAMLVGTMVDELERRDKRRAMVSLCIGAGMGISCIIERV